MQFVLLFNIAAVEYERRSLPPKILFKLCTNLLFILLSQSSVSTSYNYHYYYYYDVSSTGCVIGLLPIILAHCCLTSLPETECKFISPALGKGYPGRTVLQGSCKKRDISRACMEQEPNMMCKKCTSMQENSHFTFAKMQDPCNNPALLYPARSAGLVACQLVKHSL